MSVMLVIFLLVILQVTWFGVQKMYFNFVGSYAARVWSIKPKDSVSPEGALLRVQATAGVAQLVGMATGGMLQAAPPSLWSITRSPVVFMYADAYKDDGVEGLRFRGLGRPFDIFEPYLGTAATLAQLNQITGGQIPVLNQLAATPANRREDILFIRNSSLPDDISVLRFETFIPMDHEEHSSYGGQEVASQGDNDCSGKCSETQDNSRVD